MATTSVLDVILPKKKANPKGTGYTSTYNPNNPQVALTAPTYNEHTTDIFSSRIANNSKQLLQELFRQDPDVSATLNAYLTVASSATPWWIVYAQDGTIDREGHKLLETIMQSLFAKNDYSLGFQLKPDLTTLCNELRYMALLRGAVGAELVLDQNLLPTEVRHIDTGSLEWKEIQPGKYTPSQVPSGSSVRIDLNIPTFFISFYKRDPTTIYSYSPFVSVINTIAARQQVVNDLYRIMRKTGYPRQSIKVIEEVLRKNAPVDAQADPDAMNTWVKARLSEIATTVSNLSADQVYVHTDAVEPGMLNERNAGITLDVRPIMETLNAQNQAGLKIMATIIGRGESGVNTASVESRIFSMHADSLNQPIALMLSDMLTLCLRLSGSLSRVEFGFDTVELRPALELEANVLVKQSRLLTLLSIGLIDDDFFHIEMFNKPRPDAIPELSGTQFPVAGGPPPPPPGGTGNNPGADPQPSGLDKTAKSPQAKQANNSQVTRKAA